MYFHLGGDLMLLKSDIVGIYDLDATTVSKDTRTFLAAAESSGLVVTANAELPKSFVIVKTDNDLRIYLSSLSSVTLHKRFVKMSMK